MLQMLLDIPIGTKYKILFLVVRNTEQQQQQKKKKN